MDKYKQLMAVKGLIMSMDEELYKHFQKDNLSTEIKKRIVCEYYTAIFNFLHVEEED